MLPFKTLSLAVVAGLHAHAAWAIVFASTGDINFNTTAPAGTYANSGWQFEGRIDNFLGTVIGPQWFITAEHIGGTAGTTKFVFLGQTYTTDTFYDDPNSDLRIWHVTTPFPTYAPLYRSGDEMGKELVVYGRGPARGAEIAGKGWLWGTTNTEQRWGTNAVSGFVNAGAAFGPMLAAAFDDGASATEAMLTVGDSGGGVFIKDTDGVWKLAGVNFAVSGPYKASAGDAPFNASLYEQSGYLAQQFDSSYVTASGPGSLYATRISANLAFIHQVTGMPEPSVGAAAMAGFAMLAARRRRRG